jgi:hypothetical protein
MNSIAVILLFSIVMIVVAMLVSIGAMNFAMRHVIGRKHQALEYIANDQKIPPEWSKKYAAKLQAARDQGAGEERIAAIKRAERADYVKRLKSLETYVRKTQLVNDEQTREILLGDLRAMRARWEEGEGHDHADPPAAQRTAN